MCLVFRKKVIVRKTLITKKMIVNVFKIKRDEENARIHLKQKQPKSCYQMSIPKNKL